MKILRPNVRNEIVEFYRTVFNWHDNEIKVFFFYTCKSFQTAVLPTKIYFYFTHTSVAYSCNSLFPSMASNDSIT